MVSRTGFVWHERFGWGLQSDLVETTPPEAMFEPLPSFEGPEAKRRIRNLLDVSGVLRQLTPIEAVPAPEEDLLRVHTPEYLEKFRAASQAGGGEVGPRMKAIGQTWGIACLAAGGAIAATRAVVDGAVANAYALVRPPGHHAERDRALGFCYLANVAVACRWAQAERGIGRIAVIDWDVHHGNGTEQAFWTDPSVLTISLHQERTYPPDQGLVEHNGEGPGAGYALNIPLPPGSGHGAYMHAFERIVVPAVTKFAPELILVASGLDAGNHDMTARMMLHADSFRAMTRMMMNVAHQVCGGRLVMVHEGGYAAASAPYLALAIIEELSGIRSPVVDPFLPNWRVLPGQRLQPHQAAHIEQVAAHALRIGRI
jgi:acetoin utilization deacetylase AcuC-like enzyme